MYVYVESASNPAVRFEVLEYDKESGAGKLKGRYGAIIIRNIHKDELIKRGYRLITSEVPLTLTPPPDKPATKAAEAEAKANAAEAEAE